MNLSQTSGNFFHYPGAWAPGYLNVASPLICIGERYMYKCTLAFGLCYFPLLVSLYMFALPTWCVSIHRKVELWFLAYLCFVLRLQLRKIMVSVAWLIGWALILEYAIGGSSVARGISPNLVMLSIKSSL